MIAEIALHQASVIIQSMSDLKILVARCLFTLIFIIDVWKAKSTHALLKSDDEDKWIVYLRVHRVVISGLFNSIDATYHCFYLIRNYVSLSRETLSLLSATSFMLAWFRIVLRWIAPVMVLIDFTSIFVYIFRIKIFLNQCIYWWNEFLFSCAYFLFYLIQIAKI